MNTDYNLQSDVGDGLEHEIKLWDISFSSEFEVGDNCAKFTPCYSRRPHPELSDTEVSLLNTLPNCFEDQNEPSLENNYT